MNLINEEIVKQIGLYKEAKVKYVAIQEEKLYEKYEMTEENGKTEKDQTRKRAFITFKSMKGKERCENTFFGVKQAAKENPKEDEKKFQDKYLEVIEAEPAGAIQWQNLRYSLCCRTTTSFLFWILALLILCLAFYFMIIFKDYNDALVASAKLDTKCPSEPFEIEFVYEDYEKPPKQRQGFMHCFRLSYYNANGTVGGSELEFEKIGWEEGMLEDGQDPPC